MTASPNVLWVGHHPSNLLPDEVKNRTSSFHALLDAYHTSWSGGLNHGTISSRLHS